MIKHQLSSRFDNPVYKSVNLDELNTFVLNLIPQNLILNLIIHSDLNQKSQSTNFNHLTNSLNHLVSLILTLLTTLRRHSLANPTIRFLHQSQTSNKNTCTKISYDQNREQVVPFSFHHLLFLTICLLFIIDCVPCNSNLALCHLFFKKLRTHSK